MTVNSYEVGAVFTVKDQASETLRRLADQFNRLEGIVNGLQKKLDAMLNVKSAALESTLKGIDGQLTALTKNSDAFGTALTGRLQTADIALASTTSAVGRLNQQLSQAASSASQLRLPRSGGGGGNHQRPNAGNTGGHGNAAHVGMNLGMLGTMGFGEVAGGIRDMLKDGMELTHLQEQMRQGGVSMQDVSRATAAARTEADRYGLSIAKVMGDLKELQFPFGSMDHAIEFIDPLERMRVVLNSVSEGRGNDAADSVYKMARAGELKGLVDPEQYLSYFQNMTKVISATGGKVSPNDFMQATKFSKLAGFGFDEEFYTRYLPTMIQTMGPSTAGQSMMSLFNTLVSGAVTKRALGNMTDLGLVTDESKIRFNKQGDPVGFNPGAIAGTDELVRNPLAWARDVLTPLLEKKFGDLSVAANKESAIESLGGLFGNRNSAAAVAELALRTKSFERDSGLIGKASGLEGVEQLLNHDPTAAMNRFTESWKNLLASLGQPGVQPAIDLMNGISGGVGGITKWAAENPTGAKVLLEGATALAAALGILTGVGVIAALAFFLPGGAFAIGAAAVGGVLVSLAAFNWDVLSRGFSRIEDFIKRIGSFFGFGGAKTPEQFGPPMPMSGAAGQQLLQGLGMVPNTTGLPLGFNPTAYVTGGSNDNNPLTDAVYGGFMRAFREIQGGGGEMNAGGTGGGIISAAYTTFGGGGGSSGGGSGGAPGLNSGGADVDAILNRGGLAGFNTRGVRNMNIGNIGFGPWAKAHGAIGGAGSDTGHLVAVFPSFAAGAAAAGALALSKYRGGANSIDALVAGAHGWTPGNHGAAANIARMMGISPFADAHLDDPAAMERFKQGLSVQELGPAGARYAWGKMRSIPPAGRQGSGVIHNHIHLDGKQITASVSRHQGASSRFPTSVGAADGHSFSTNPGTPLLDVA